MPTQALKGLEQQDVVYFYDVLESNDNMTHTYLYRYYSPLGDRMLIEPIYTHIGSKVPKP